MDALEQLNLAAPITDTYTAIEQMIICRIAEQIAGNPQGLINNSSEWRIQMLARMGRLTKDTAKIIATQSKGVGNKIEAAIDASVQSVLKQNGLTLTNELSENISSALSAYDRQAIRSKYNQVNTVMQYKAKQAALNAINGTASRFDRMMQKELDSKQEYLDVLNKATMSVALGERSRTEAIRATVEEMSAKGIPAFIDSSGREWSPEGYVNMDIRNTVKNAANAAQFACIEELGQDVVLVSSHTGARPLCAPYQGKFYSLSGKSGTIRDARGKEYTFEPWSSTSYGEAAGLLGINCGHSIRGVSDGMFINREKQYDEKENSEEYDKVVKQRELERKIRKQKTTRNALKAAGDDEGVREYDRKIKETTAQLNAYCEKNGLTVRMDRTEVYGYSDTSRKKAHTDFVETIDNFGKSGIIENVNKSNDFMKEVVSDDEKTWSFKTNPLGDYNNVWSQTYSENAKAMAKYVTDKISNGDYGSLDRVVIAKFDSLHGISSYDHVNNVLYISEELIDSDMFKNMVGTDYFAAETLDEVIDHELRGHKKHWDIIKRYKDEHPKESQDLLSAKHRLEEKLHEYIGVQRKSDLSYIRKTVSRNADFAYMDSAIDYRLNELIADVEILRKRGTVTDNMLFDLVEELMNK